MTPFDRIAEQYLLRPEEEPFAWYVEQHLKRGFLFSTPEFFVMGLPVQTYLLKLDVHPLNHAHQSEPPDCWYVSAMAGDMGKAWSILPYELPFIAWHRDRADGKELSIHASDRIKGHSLLT